MLETGFEHSLTYEETVESGKTCKFCRLIVCSLSKLQVRENMYEIDRDYDAWAKKLTKLPYVVRTPVSIPRFKGPVEFMEPPPEDLWWTRNVATEKPYLNGFFNDGATIQISSIYEEQGLLLAHDVEPANSSRNTNLLHKWLRNCIEDHPKCRQSFSGGIHELDELLDEVHPLPTRVIDVGLKGETVRIVASNGMRGMYTTLSHRWGKQKMVKTLISNLSQHLRGIEIGRLPQTFKDSIEITRKLGIKYLWIDSLCIVQDSNDDWACEAAQMGTIFEHSSCTIAAVDAIDEDCGTDRGLFLPRDKDPLTVRLNCAWDKVLVENTSIDDSASNERYGWMGFYLDDPENSPLEHVRPEHVNRHQIVAKPRMLSHPWTVMRSAWHRRGWILQERILSRRIIYYTKSKLSWDCYSHSGEEEMLGISAEPLRVSYLTRMNWKELVADYTKCQLTFNSDKLQAVSGLSDRLERRTGRKCFAGIVEDEDDPVGMCLLWHADGINPLTKHLDFHAPSWSWAAYDGKVTYSTQTMTTPSTVNSLISKLAFETRTQCLVSGCSNKKNTCVSGYTSFNGPVGTACRAGHLGILQSRKDEDLISILGSAVHWEANPTPRIVEGEIKISQRQLSLPDRTEILRDESGSTIGWALLDTDEGDISGNEIICAAVSLSARSGVRPKTPFGRVDGFDYMNEQYVDILALRVGQECTTNYVRIGRGRIVKKDWLATCSREDVLIW